MDALTVLGDRLVQAFEDFNDLDRANFKADARSKALIQRRLDGAGETIHVLENAISAIQAETVEGALVQARVLADMSVRLDKDSRKACSRLIYSIAAVLEAVSGISRSRFAGNIYLNPRLSPFAKVAELQQAAGTETATYEV